MKKIPNTAVDSRLDLLSLYENNDNSLERFLFLTEYLLPRPEFCTKNNKRISILWIIKNILLGLYYAIRYFIKSATLFSNRRVIPLSGRIRVNWPGIYTTEKPHEKYPYDPDVNFVNFLGDYVFHKDVKDVRKSLDKYFIERYGSLFLLITSLLSFLVDYLRFLVADYHKFKSSVGVNGLRNLKQIPTLYYQSAMFERFLRTSQGLSHIDFILWELPVARYLVKQSLRHSNASIRLYQHGDFKRSQWPILDLYKSDRITYYTYNHEQYLKTELPFDNMRLFSRYEENLVPKMDTDSKRVLLITSLHFHFREYSVAKDLFSDYEIVVKVHPRIAGSITYNIWQNESVSYVLVGQTSLARNVIFDTSRIYYLSNDGSNPYEYKKMILC